VHPLILRQLRKAGIDPAVADPALARLLAAVSDAYLAADDDRRQLEHSLKLASEELYERNRRLQQELEQRAVLSEKLVHTTQHRAETERQYRAVFELSPVGVLAVDLATGCVLHVNDAMVGATGHSREQLLSLAFADLVAAAPGERATLATPEATRFGPQERRFRRRDGSTFDALVSGIRTTDELGRTVGWAIVQDISERKAFERQLAEAARRDRLTGLSTRTVFIERLDDAIARVRTGVQSVFAVFYLDFDRFKFVNDTLGHDAGDELLRQIATRLAALVAPDGGGEPEARSSIVSRFGGDEFLVLANGLAAPEDAVGFAERIVAALAPAYSIRGREVHSTASIGIVTSAECLTSAEEVVRKADVAMYEAKHLGRGRALLFNHAMHARLTRRVAIEHGLRRGLRAGEFRLVYQPIVDLTTGTVVSAEALLRWTHPTLGEIEPSEFVPLAEDAGLIVDLGRWLQREACAQLVRWRTEDPLHAPATVSVNLSRVEVALGAPMLAQVRDALAATGLPAGALQLEVTERGIVRDRDAARALLLDLRALGVRVAMDDFGTGDSSLGLLRHFPFDAIKIDRSFVEDLTASPDGLAVLHASVNLIENLGMTSIVEGVEQLSQVAVLQSLGCRCAQGLYFGGAVPPGEFLDAVRRRAAAAFQKTA
jgi:diguanylate cyclase (GGDEF)-like protein/PAS domain S-box-containing protein